MNAYSVRCISPGAFNGFRAEVDGPGGVRGIGYGHTERAAIANAWRAYWRKAGMRR